MLSNGEDEISEVIDERALKARASKTEAPPSGFAKLASPATAFLRAITGWPQALVALGILALAGLYLWLNR